MMIDPHVYERMDQMSEADLEAFRARQKSRNRMMGLVLGGLAILFFAITIVKLGASTPGAA